MIYAAYAGTGKSTFCHEHPEAIDLICMPFKYINLSEVSEGIDSGRKGEQIKASQDLHLRESWVLYYYWAIKRLLYYCPEQPIVIPTIGRILDFLETDHIPYTIIYPDKGLKDEYEMRYRNRGNTDEFLDVFIGRWDAWIECLEQRNSALAKHIVLQKGQYVSDVVKCTFGCDEYKKKQLEMFKQKIYQSQGSTFQGIALKEDEADNLDLHDDTIHAVFYLRPVCEDDMITDFVWISSERQLDELLHQYKHDDFYTVPELMFLESCYTKDGICCKELVERKCL